MFSVCVEFIKVTEYLFLCFFVNLQCTIEFAFILTVFRRNNFLRSYYLSFSIGMFFPFFMGFFPLRYNPIILVDWSLPVKLLCCFLDLIEEIIDTAFYILFNLLIGQNISDNFVQSLCF